MARVQRVELMKRGGGTSKVPGGEERFGQIHQTEQPIPGVALNL